MRLAVFFVFLLCLPVFAAQQVEIIELRHRVVEDVLPVLTPMLEAGGAISGMSGHLVVRTSPANLEELRKVLAVIDRPPRQLLIRVSQSRDATVRQREVGVSGRIRIGENVEIVGPGGPRLGGSEAKIREGGSFASVYGRDTRRTTQGGADQFVRVMDGGEALIRIGRSLAVPFRRIAVRPGGVRVSEGVVYMDVGQGFFAVPRLVGESVSIEIRPFFDSPGPGLDVETQELSTTVTGRLGEWIELGGSSQQVREDTGRLTGAGSMETRDTRSVWLLVDEER
ncbi:MAG: hypothetical protein CVU60_10570 [Deltaproteobacteria bacterium HGW-Deltaproteobacteria-18]|nr:MAG: hypothetical protein CVU60_10570 [Deltaproteobacteria bacterium HGW-Deltaproteobacteria-18]